MRRGMLNLKRNDGLRGALACAVAASAFFAGPRAHAAPPGVVRDFEVERYLGRWYEIASTQPGFQEGCSCTRADYGATTDPNVVEVVNSCVRPDGSLSRVEGTARVVDPDEPAKLRVSFGGLGDFFSRLLGSTNYWVVALGEEYRWAVVSTRFRRPAWILARDPRLEPSTLAEINDRLTKEGFDVNALLSTKQDGCVVPPP